MEVSKTLTPTRPLDFQHVGVRGNALYVRGMDTESYSSYISLGLPVKPASTPTPDIPWIGKMAITEYIVRNISDVTNPPGIPYTIAGVVIDPGTSRNLTDDGVSLEEVARDAEYTAGLLAGDLLGPAQSWWIDQANAGETLAPGSVYYVSPSTTGPFSLVLPPAAITTQVYIAPIRVFNASVHNVSLTLTGTDTVSPPGSLSLGQDERTELWSILDPVTNIWGYLSIR